MAKRVLNPATVQAKGSYSPRWEVSGGSRIQLPKSNAGR